MKDLKNLGRDSFSAFDARSLTSRPSRLNRSSFPVRPTDTRKLCEDILEQINGRSRALTRPENPLARLALHTSNRLLKMDGQRQVDKQARDDERIARGIAALAKQTNYASTISKSKPSSRRAAKNATNVAALGPQTNASLATAADPHLREGGTPLTREDIDNFGPCMDRLCKKTAAMDRVISALSGRSVEIYLTRSTRLSRNGVPKESFTTKIIKPIKRFFNTHTEYADAAFACFIMEHDRAFLAAQIPLYAALSVRNKDITDRVQAISGKQLPLSTRNAAQLVHATAQNAILIPAETAAHRRAFRFCSSMLTDTLFSYSEEFRPGIMDAITSLVLEEAKGASYSDTSVAAAAEGYALGLLQSVEHRYEKRSKEEHEGKLKKISLAINFAALPLNAVPAAGGYLSGGLGLVGQEVASMLMPPPGKIDVATMTTAMADFDNIGNVTWESVKFRNARSHGSVLASFDP